jgi:hypothetical protein
MDHLERPAVWLVVLALLSLAIFLIHRGVRARRMVSTRPVEKRPLPTVAHDDSLSLAMDVICNVGGLTQRYGVVHGREAANLGEVAAWALAENMTSVQDVQYPPDSQPSHPVMLSPSGDFRSPRDGQPFELMSWGAFRWLVEKSGQQGKRIVCFYLSEPILATLPEDEASKFRTRRWLADLHTVEVWTEEQVENVKGKRALPL